MKSNKKKICIFAVIILIIIAGVGIHNYNTKFITEKWTDISNLDGRIKWIEDLEKKYSIIGMSNDEIEQILGSPSMKTNPNKQKEYQDFEEEGADEYWCYRVKDDILAGWKIYLLGFKDGKVVGKTVITAAL